MQRPSDLLTAADDADLARLVRRIGGPPIRVAHGDLARTLGSPPRDEASSALELPLDLVEVTSDGGEFVACAHVVARRRWSRGGWWFGPVTVVMNVEFIGDWDVAPRGHPNDGRLEVLQADSRMSLRERFAVRHRLPGGTHVPHPLISTRSVREATFEFEHPMGVFVDGVGVGSSRSLSVRVSPDAAIVYV